MLSETACGLLLLPGGLAVTLAMVAFLPLTQMALVAISLSFKLARDTRNPRFLNTNCSALLPRQGPRYSRVSRAT